MENLVGPALAFITAHASWAVAVLFVVTFGESFAVIGIAFPGTSLLLAAGALVGTGALPALPIAGGAVLGAIVGDGVSYALGRHFGERIERVWPFNRDPRLISRGVRFFARHGGKSVFIGRFFGPMRGIVPLVAGVLRMLPGRYWFVNVVSAFVWAPFVLGVGAVAGRVGIGFLASEHRVLILIVVILALVGLGALWLAVHRKRGEN